MPVPPGLTTRGAVGRICELAPLPGRFTVLKKKKKIKVNGKQLRETLDLDLSPPHATTHTVCTYVKPVDISEKNT